jgi:ATP-binding cassette subfamily B protein
MLALIILQTGSGVFYDAMGHSMGAMMERDIRRDFFSHIQKLPYSFFDNQRTGSLMSRITNDLLNLAEFYHHGPEDFILSFLRIAGAFVILLQINMSLALLTFACLPLMLVYSFLLLGRLQRAYRESREKIAEVNSQLEDSLSGIRVVKSFANEAIEEKKFSITNNEYLNSRNCIYTTEAWYFSVLDYLFVPLVLVAIIIFGGLFISQEKLSVPDLIVFMLYAGYLTAPISRMAQAIERYQDGIAGFNRFMDIMEIAPEPAGGKITLHESSLKGDIRFEDVSFKYHDEGDTVLKNISLDIKAGEYIAVVGPSGAGKTTLCSLIPRYYEVRSGTIYIDGQDVKDYTIESLRRNIGVVQQDVYLFAGTAMENIMYGKPGASEEEIIAAAKKANAHDFISTLPKGYNTYIGQRGVLLSGGQKQRISIARVFLKNPPILIFDEATSALDNESEEVIRRSLRDLSLNRTTLVIAHRLSTIRHAGRILVLTDEGIVEQGTHGELLARNGVYARLYRTLD